MDHKHTPEEERRIREAALDRTIAESFPASDAPSTLPNPDDDALLPDDGGAEPDAEESPRPAGGRRPD